MADARADIIIDVDTSVGIAEIKNLQRQISELNAQLLQSGAQQARAAQNVQRNLINNINATGDFAARVRTISSTTESFTRALETNKLSMGQYFRYAAGSTRTFGRLFKREFDTISRVAESRVKTLQTQYIKLGRDASGAMKSIAVRPLALDMKNLSTQTALAAQRQQLFNQLIKQGSTNLLNFGKNTQWAGRQLMVGFSIPLAYLGTIASKTFMKMEEQAIRFKRVYGDTFTASADTDKMIKQVQQLANEFTKYGVQVEKTMEMAADAAAMGKMGADLLSQISEATRLAVLGGVEQEKALETTISLTNAFGTAAEDLAGKIDFLNAVENQTVTAIEDLTIAIPKAAPVIKQLGGNVEDLAFFLTAMKEGGINASEGANALKSGLASLINPTRQANEMLQGFGININGIVEANKGDVKGTVVQFAQALDQLDPLNRARAIEQLFGKFQFSRLSTLFQNVIKEGSQAQRVLELTRNSTEELAILSERELKRVEDSPMYKFKKAVEDLKVSLVPLGEAFLKAITPLAEFAKGFLDRFNSMSDEAKNFAVIATTVVAGIGPVLLMTFGLIANGVANLIKMFAFFGSAMRGGAKSTNDLSQSTEYMTQQQLEAASVAASLDQAHSKLVQTFGVESAAVDKLSAAYARAVVNQSRLLGINPETGMPLAPGTRVPRPKKYNSGVVSVPGPKGKGDIVPAMLAPGEAVIPADMAKKHRGFISDMINDNLPGYRFGLNPFANMLGRSRVAARMPQAALEQMISGGKKARYSSAFTTGTGADYLTQSGFATPKTKAMRSNVERDLFGLGENANPLDRPTYGYARTSPLQALINKLFGFRGKQFNAVTSGKMVGDRGKNNMIELAPGKWITDPSWKPDTLKRYGDVDVVTKGSVAKRSQAMVGDALLDYERVQHYSRGQNGLRFAPAPMRGASRAQLDKAMFDQRLNNPFGSYKSDPINSPNSFTANPKPPYVETYTPGGFQVGEISKIIAKDRSTARQLQKLVDQAGLKIRVTPQNAPSIIKLFSNMFGTRFEDGVLNFSGKNFPLGSQSKVDTLRKTIQMLQANGISDARILSRIENLYYRDTPELTSGKLRKNFGFTAAGAQTNRGKGGSSAPAKIMDLKKKLAPAFDQEIKEIQAYAKQLGLTDRQVKDLVTVDAAHLRNTVGADGKKIWNPKDITADLGYVNKYISHFAQSKDSQKLLSMSNQQLKSMGINRAELSALLNGNHPTTVKAVETLKAIARWRTVSGSSQAARMNSKVLSYGLDRRISSGFYNTPMATLDSVMKGTGTATKEALPKPPKPPSSSAASKTPQSVASMQNILQAGSRFGAPVPAGRAGLFARLFGRKYANGVVSVPGPKGKGDVVPAMLSPGEAVIPAKESKKYAPLIQQMVHGKIPGYSESNVPKPPEINARSGKIIKNDTPPSAAPRVTNIPGFGTVGGETTPAERARLAQTQGEATGKGLGATQKFTNSLKGGLNDVVKNKLVGSMDENRGLLGKLGRNTAIRLGNIAGNDIIDSKGNVINSGANATKGFLGAQPVTNAKAVLNNLANKTAVTAAQQVQKYSGQISTAATGGIVAGAPASARFAPVIQQTLDKTITGVAQKVEQAAVQRQMVPAGPLMPGGQFSNDPNTQKAYQQQEKKALRAEQKALRAERKAELKANRAAMGGGGVGGGLLSMAGMGAMAYGMTGGPGAEMAMMASMPLMMAPMLLPMLKNPIVLAVTALAGLGAGVLAVKNHFDKLEKSSAEFAEKMGLGNDAMNVFAQAAGNVTATDIIDRRRESEGSLLQIQPGKSAFGDNFLQSETGKAYLKDVQSNIVKFGNEQASQDLKNQLFNAVASGALDVGQARSIAASIGQQINDLNFGMSVNAYLSGIFGPNGENLLTDPLSITIKMIDDSESSIDDAMIDWANATTKFGTGGSMLDDLLFNDDVAANFDAVMVDKIGTVKEEIENADWGLFDFTKPLVQMVANIDPLSMRPFGTSVYQWLLGTEEDVNLLDIGVALSNTFTEAATEVTESYGKMLGSVAGNLSNYQQALDTTDVLYQKQIDAATASGELEKAELWRTKQLTARQEVLERYSGAIGTLTDNFNILGSVEREQLNESLDERILEKIEDKDVKEKTKEILEQLSSGVESGEIKADVAFVLKAQLDADVIGTDDITNFMSMTGSARSAIMRIIPQMNPRDYKRVMDISNIFLDKNGNPNNTLATKFVAKFEGADQQEIDSLLKLYNMVGSLEGLVGKQAASNVAGFYLQSPKDSETLLGDLEDIKEATQQDFKIEVIQELMGDDVAAVVAKDQEYFNSLDPVNKILYLQVLATMALPVMTGDMDQEILNWAAENGKALPNTSMSYVNDTIMAGLREKYLQNQSWMATVSNMLAGALGEEDPGDGGGEKKDPYKDILSRLKQIRNAAINAAGGIDMLRKAMKAGSATSTKFLGTDQKLLFAGYSVEFIDAINSMDEETKKEFVSIENGVVKVKEAGKLLSKAMSEIRLGDFQFSLVSGVAAINNQMSAMTKLSGAGMSTADAFEVVQDEALAYAIATATTSSEVKQLVKDFEALKKAQEQLQLSTPEGTQQWLSDYSGALTNATSKVAEYFAAQRSIVEQDFTTGANKSNRNEDLLNIKSITDSLESARADILDYQDTLDDLDFDLSTIEDKEDDVNKKYDERLEALNKIWEANSDIEQQQKAQLDIAQALASGDISAAARAMQEEQRRRAQKAREDQEKAIEAARESELEQLRSKSGKTRKQLEDEIAALNEKIVAIEEDRLEPNERLLRLAEAQRQAALEAVGEDGYLGQTEEAWGKIESAARLAVVQSDAFRESLKKILDVIPGFSIDEDGNVLFDEKAFEAGIPTPGGSSGSASTPETETPTTTAPTAGPELNTKNSSYAVVANAKAGLYGETAAPVAANAGVINRDTAEAAAKAAVKGAGITAGGVTIKASSTADFAKQVMDTVLANRKAVNDGSLSDAEKKALTQQNIDLMKTTGLRFATGGLVPKYFAAGGFARGTDTVPAMLTPGEFVMRKYAVSKYGLDKMKAMNTGSYKNDSVYNYSVNVSVKSNANPDDIASAVMTRIKQIDSQRIRSNRY